MSGPEFEGVLVDHRTLANSPSDSVCACDRTWRKTSDYRAHLSAALHAELARWLGDEGTREVVALTLFADEQVARHESVEHRWDTTLSDDDRNEYRNLATAALAALTTTDQEDHR